jgi:hypothetical protein
MAEVWKGERHLDLLWFGSNSSEHIAKNERANKIKNSHGNGEAANHAQGSLEFAISVKIVT